MADRVIRMYRKQPGGQIDAIEMSVADAEFALARFPFAWSTWPGRAGKCEPYDWPPATMRRG
jgi:hypothetical protein